MVEIIIFPKKCPECKGIMRTVVKMHASWYECVVCELPTNYMRR